MGDLQDRNWIDSRGVQHSMRAIMLAFSACLLFSAGPASAAQKVTTKADAVSEDIGPRTSAQGSTAPQAPVERTIDVIVVWGFRIRSTEHDLRAQSLRSGYSELVEKSACLTAMCGFVVVPDGTKWRATNVISATETELYEMQRNLERTGSVLVIVHPSGIKRPVPEF